MTNLKLYANGWLAEAFLALLTLALIYNYQSQVYSGSHSCMFSIRSRRQFHELVIALTPLFCPELTQHGAQSLFKIQLTNEPN